jgi:hypothetical protein
MWSQSLKNPGVDNWLIVVPGDPGSLSGQQGSVLQWVSGSTIALYVFE